jgi:hypothetical protein
MSTTVRQMHLGDLVLTLCNQNDEEMEQYAKLTGRPFFVDGVVLDILNRPGDKWALVDDKRPNDTLVVGGFTPINAGTAASWCYVHKDAWATYAGPVTVQCRRMVERALQNGAHRVETLCLAGRPHVQKWYEKLGLHYEATLHKFGADGTDAVIHAALRESV